MEPGIGDQFGDRYRVEGPLGSGGMGQLFVARDQRLDRQVALKVLPRNRIGDAVAVERLIREARATASLEHPHIVHMYDVGATGDGGAYLAMELIRGQDLRARLRSGPLPLEEATRILRQVGEALAFAHRKGVVHRDIKPDNVMVRDDGRAVVLDYGLARSLRSEAEQNGLTAQGTFLGTPEYCPPEQARGQKVDGTADQFAFAVMAHELLSGEIPWQGDTLPAVLACVLTEEPRELDETTPTAIRDGIRRALSKSASARFPSMEDLLEAMAIEPESSSADAPPAGDDPPADDPPADAPGDDDQMDTAPRTPSDARPQSSPVGRVTVGLIVLLVVIAGGYYGLRPGPEPPDDGPARAASSPPPPDTPPGLLSLPPPDCRPDALPPYGLGIRALRDGNWSQARRALAQAAEADPDCPQAQLRHAIVGASFAEPAATRPAYVRAMELRDRLDDRHQALLTAYEPLFMEDPADRAEFGRRTAALAERFPEDPEMLFLGAFESTASMESRLRWAHRAAEIDPGYADAWQTVGRLLSEMSNDNGALEALDQCAEQAPLSTDCIHQRLLIQSRLGFCEDLETRARELRVRSPDSPLGDQWLATAFAQRGGPAPEVLRHLEAFWSKVSEERRPFVESLYRARVLAWNGEFEPTVELGRAALTRADGLGGNRPEVRAASILVAALTELGRDDEAAEVATEVLRRIRAHPGSVTWDGVAFYREAQLLRAARGGLPEPEWLSHLEAFRGRLEATPWIRPYDAWALGDAAFAQNEEEAHNSVTRGDLLAGPEEIDPRAQVPSYFFAGEVLGMTGHRDRAVAALRRATRGCRHLDHPMLTMRAYLLLGEQQADGDPRAACAAYHVPWVRWRHAAGDSQTAREVLRRFEQTGCQ